MEVYERVRLLRKDTLKMSMEAFGKRLGDRKSTRLNSSH